MKNLKFLPLELIPHPSLHTLSDSVLTSASVDLQVLRLDQIHPQLGGNKYYKLRHNLLTAKSQGFQTILTFGGAYSNHIYATAAAGQLYGFQTIGIIRGEQHLPLNATLQFAQECGMQLHYLDRDAYRHKHDPALLARFQQRFGDFYLIPEGGTNVLALTGVKEMIKHSHTDFDWICTPCGTGGTLAGLLLGLKPYQKALGFSALKGGVFLVDEVKTLLQQYQQIHPEVALPHLEQWSIQLAYHFGGYAKRKPALDTFITDFQNTHQMPIEWIYTGKMFYGIYDLIKKGFFEKGQRILALHTGGLRS